MSSLEETGWGGVWVPHFESNAPTQTMSSPDTHAVRCPRGSWVTLGPFPACPELARLYHHRFWGLGGGGEAL